MHNFQHKSTIWISCETKVSFHWTIICLKCKNWLMQQNSNKWQLMRILASHRQLILVFHHFLIFCLTFAHVDDQFVFLLLLSDLSFCAWLSSNLFFFHHVFVFAHVIINSSFYYSRIFHFMLDHYQIFFSLLMLMISLSFLYCSLIFHFVLDHR